jgi:putative ABC transport system permease protein
MLLRTTFAGVRAHPGRLVATLLVVTLGVGFVSGTMIFGDTAKASLFDQFARAARNVDVVVLAPEATASHSPASPPTLPVETLDAVRGVPGVAGAEGRYAPRLALLDQDGRLLSNADLPGYAISAGADPALRPYDVVDGRVPSARGEAAVDERTAAHAGFAVGDRVTVVGADQRQRTLTLVGIVELAAASRYSGYSVLALTDPELVAVARPAGYAEIVVRAATGTDPAELADRVAAVVGDEPTVRTGEQHRIELAQAAVSGVNEILFGLSVFGLVALVVAAFVIYNTFAILVAHRVRELALLRCVGADRRQVLGMVLLEAALAGLAGVALGVAVGLGIAYAMFHAFGWLGTALPFQRPVLSPAPFLVALLVGVGVTTLSATVPAIRASRTAPLAALRTDPDAGLRTVRGRRLRAGLGGLVGALGLALSLAGAFGPWAGTGTGPGIGEVLVIGGGMVAFLGLLVVAPLFIGPLTALLGGLPGRRWTPARLAVANGRRNPGRAAVTTATLMVGVGLMSVFSVVVASASATFDSNLSDELPVDYGLVATEIGAERGIPAEVVSALRARPEFEGGVVAVHSTTGAIEGRGTVVSAADLAVLRPEVTAGSLADLRPGTAVLTEGEPVTSRTGIGDQVTVTVAGEPATYRVVAVVKETPGVGTMLLDPAEHAQRYGSGLPASVLLRAAPGTDAVASRAAVDAVVAGHPLISVSSVADYREELTAQINGLLGFFAGLLAVSIVIALIGIANTISLSVVERRRELAMQRALGMTRGQLRATLLVEALLVAAVGGLIGTGFGLGYGALVTRTIFVDPVLGVPGWQLLGYAVLAAVAGALAAVVPARRAARAVTASSLVG